MSRPRKHRTGLPSYCQRDRKTGALWMHVPDETRKSGLRRQAYPTLDAMLAAWRTTWGDAKRRQGRYVGDC